MKTTKSIAIFVAVASLVLLGGCTSLLTGDEPITASAEVVAPTDAALNEVDYELAHSDSPSINESITVAEQKRTVQLSNEVVAYQRNAPDGMPSTATFTVLSTPSVKVAGQPVNPLAQMTNDQLVSTVIKHGASEQLGDLSKVDEYEITVNGAETTVTKYEATTTVQGQEVEMYLHLTKVQVGDNTVLAVGGYPQADGDAGQQEVETLMKSLTEK